MATRLVIIILSWLMLGPSVHAAPKDEAPLVQAATGKIAGATDGAVERFLNIPFAAPPVGQLRWRAPQPASHWKGIRNASKMGPACPQPMRPALVAGGVADNQSEDCLQLNVWRPKGAKNLPVMVWLHGGAHVIGSATFPAFDGTAFAKQGVILVTVNYRLGALGYFAHPALTAAAQRGEAFGNYGLMDQLAALRWVKANIARFGGDPAKVTLFGESAGAIGVTNLLSISEAKGLFARAIIQSGIALDEPRTLSVQEAMGSALARRAGSPVYASAKDLRAISADALVKAGDVRSLGAIVGPFQDGKLVREAPWRIFKRRKAIDVPLLIGANSNEASVIFAMGIPAIAADRYLGPDIAAGRAAYGAELGEEERARQILGDAWFVAPARWLAGQTQGGAPSYLYHFDYVAEARRDRAPGAAHGSEIPYLFGTLDYFASLAGPVERQDRLFGAELSACWVAFAKFAEPRCALVADWPRFDQDKDQLALLGLKSAVISNFRKRQTDHLLQAHFSAEAGRP